VQRGDENENADKVQEDEASPKKNVDIPTNRCELGASKPRIFAKLKVNIGVRIGCQRDVLLLFMLQ
jgi:hypothetical protein